MGDVPLKMSPSSHTLHIIHLPHRSDRLEKLMQELQEQCISDFIISPGVYHDLPYKGIAAAHCQLVALARRLAWPKIRIAEDDIHFTASGAFDYYIAQEPTSVDIYLGSVTYGDYNADHSLVEDFAGLTLYTVYAPFYDTFLSVLPDEHLDRGLRHKGRYAFCHPMVAVQHEGYSDNHGKLVNYKSCFKNATLFGT